MWYPPKLKYLKDCLGGESPRFRVSCRLCRGGGGPVDPLQIAPNPIDFGTKPAREFELNWRSVYGLAVTAALFL